MDVVGAEPLKISLSIKEVIDAETPCPSSFLSSRRDGHRDRRRNSLS